MILFSTRNCNDFKNSSSGILSVAHHPAVFLIHAGMGCAEEPVMVSSEDLTLMILF